MNYDDTMMVTLVIGNNQFYQSFYTNSQQRQELEKEDFDLSYQRQISAKELEGRQSGSKEWIEERGEGGKGKIESYIETIKGFNSFFSKKLRKKKKVNNHNNNNGDND